MNLKARPGRVVSALLMALAMLLLIVTGPGVGSAPTTAPALKAAPQLLALAAANPTRTVGVIVQQAGADSTAAQLVQRLGGRITTDLHIINGFAATLPAGQVPALSAAAGVRWVSLDAPVQQAGWGGPINTANLANTYIREIGADQVWNSYPYYQGQYIGVAVVDSGVNPQQDLYTFSGTNRIVANVRFNSGYNQSTFDGYGHGTHVAGIIGGNGARSNGTYIGVAPNVNLVNVKVTEDDGSATASNLVAGLQWINDHHDQYNIRVVNLSLNSSVAASYNTDPIDAAVEILWFNRIVVVASAGNNGTATLFPPANDPFVITVGAVDDRGTNSPGDDTVASFSAYGTTADGFAKPDLVAPGKNIVSLLANTNEPLATAHPGNVVTYGGNPIYFRMSGTSMAAPMVAGAAALLIQSNPCLTPDQVKYRLKTTANRSWAAYNATQAGAGLLNVYAAVHGSSTQSANTGTPASALLWTGSQPVTWGSVAWNSVAWNSVAWNSVAWNSVAWNSVAWNSDYWGP